MWIVRLALRRPYTIAVFSFVILLLGSLSITRMRADIFPTIDIPVVLVVWNYPGMSADDMEKRVTFLSERAYSATVDGISRVESQTISGTSLVKLYFEPGADIGGAIAQVNSVSSTATRLMPPGMQPPAIIRYNASNVPVAQMTVSSPTLNEQQLFDYGLNFIRLRLFTVPGLATPAPYGGKQRQIMVDVDPSLTAAHGLSPQDVVTTLLQSNITQPAGSARMGNTEFDVAMNNSPDAIPDFNKMPIKTVGGAPVFLGDVAKVHDGFAVQNNIVRVNGQRATYLAVLKKASASTIAVVDSTKDLIPAIKAAAPEGMEIKLDFDQSTFVRAAIKGVLHEAVVSSALVSLMILFFLGSWRSVVIVSTSIPLAIFVALLGLYLTGQTLNIMTLGGLALAIGMLVDDATVEVENIHRNRHLGKPLTVAILDGAAQIATPALAATLTICIVFFPVVLLTGPAKFLFVPLALSVVFSMLASYLLSRTLVPTLARMLMDKEPLHADGNGAWDRFNRWRDRGFDRFQAGYTRLLSVVLNHRKFTIAIGLAVVLITLPLGKLVGTDFFPQVDAGQMQLHVRGPAGMRIEETEQLVSQVEQTIREVIPPKDLGNINDNIGMPTFYNLAFVQTDSVGGQDADVLVSLKEEHAPTAMYQSKLRTEFAKRFPGVHLYFQPADIISKVLNFGLSAPLDIEVEGRDMDKSMEIAKVIQQKIKAIPGVVDVRIPQVFDHPALQVDVDRERAAQMGLQQRDIASNLLTSLSSSSLVSPSFWVSPQNGVNYSVVVQTPIDRVSSVSELRGMPLTTGNHSIQDPGTAPGADDSQPGVAPYLGALSQVRPTQTKSLVTHDAVQREVEVQAGVEGRDLGSVAADIQKVLKDVGKDLPPGMKLNLRGQSESMNSSFFSLGTGLILAAVLVYVLMVVLYQSWLDPFIIMFAVPGALSGVLWMLAITHTTLNVESLMGAIMAVGVAVSNSILLVNFANEVREGHDIGPLAAALEAGKTRLRPVLMTALAMILGMIPMALGTGEGGEQNAPLGRAVIGGLLVATCTTLFIVPLIYSLLRRKAPTKHKLDEKFEAEAHEAYEPVLVGHSVSVEGSPS
ncbi:efflux RND transporter permease subunit [Pendulispora rubella]|uniref:Efflux RND transporter permease subunit n=1 Tax=Pendulispora rubella TaxID=2741070 RepID=A0ABZ2LCN7_9BACT